MLVLMACTGCTHERLQSDTLDVAGTLTNLQYQLVLNNMAMMSLYPDMLPAHVKLDSGTIQISGELGAEIGVASWGEQAVRNAIKGRLLLKPDFQTTQQWDVVPVTDPRELRDLQAAYRTALGLDVKEDLLEKLDVPVGWFDQGRAAAVPAGAVYHGCYRAHCVWVMPSHLDGLSRFTLAVLSITELKSDERRLNRGLAATPR